MFLQKIKQKISQSDLAGSFSLDSSSAMPPIQSYRISGQSAFPRTGFSAVYTSNGNQIIIFGGMTNQIPTNEVSVISMSGLSNFINPLPVTGTPPTPRVFHSASLVKNKIYVFGGIGSNGSHDDGLYCFSIDTKSWSRPRIPSSYIPRGRHGHASIVVKNLHLFIHGGQCEDGYLNDMVLLNLNNLRFENIRVPEKMPARAYHTLNLYGDSKVVIFGGECGFDCFDDVWIFDASINSWKECKINSPNKPCPRYQHAADVYGKYLIVFGGKDFTGKSLDDIWAFDLENHIWTFVCSLPLPRNDLSACKIKENVYLVGGHDLNCRDKDFNSVFIVNYSKLKLGSLIKSAGSDKSGSFSHGPAYISSPTSASPPDSPIDRLSPVHHLMERAPLEEKMRPPPPPIPAGPTKSVPETNKLENNQINKLEDDVKNYQNQISELASKYQVSENENFELQKQLEELEKKLQDFENKSAYVTLSPPPPLTDIGSPPPHPSSLSKESLENEEQMKKKLDAALDLIKTQEQVISDQEKQILVLQQNTDKLEQDLHDNNSFLMKTIEEKRDLEERYLKAAEALANRIEKLETEKQEIESNYNQNIKDLQLKIKSTENENSRLLQLEKNAKSSGNTNDEHFQKKIQILTKELEEAKNALKANESTIDTFEKEVNEYQNTIAELKNSLSLLNTDKCNISQELNGEKSKNDSLTEEISKLRESLQREAQCSSDLAALKSDLSLLEKELESARESETLAAKLKEELKRAHDELDSLKYGGNESHEAFDEVKLIRPSVPPPPPPPPPSSSEVASIAVVPPPPPPPPPPPTCRSLSAQSLASPITPTDSHANLLAEIQKGKQLKPASTGSLTSPVAPPIDPMARMLAEMQKKLVLRSSDQNKHL